VIELCDRFNETIRLLTVLVGILWYLDGSTNSRIPLSASFCHPHTTEPVPPQGFWSKKLANITEKRNRLMRDAVNKAARLVISHCLDNQIGTLVFGWNRGQKDRADMGKRTNQKFVQIPTARLKERIAQLCKQYGICFVETEESYTLKNPLL
jgi:IS605 OrfB family transposase